MSQYRDDKIGLRWRIEREVIAGKGFLNEKTDHAKTIASLCLAGQFICGNKRCDETEKLRSYEVFLLDFFFVFMFARHWL